MAGIIGADLDLDKLDRSHRVGTPKAATSRDIIVKSSIFRVRQSLYTARKELKTHGFGGVFINEDLTQHRRGLLFKAWALVRERRLIGPWSSNGTILIKDNGEIVHRILKPEIWAVLKRRLLVPLWLARLPPSNGWKYNNTFFGGKWFRFVIWFPVIRHWVLTYFILCSILIGCWVPMLFTPTNHSHAKPLSIPILVNYFLWNVFM